MAEFTDEQLAIIDRRFRRLLRDVRRQEQLKGHVSQLDPLKVALQGSGDDVYVTSRAAGLQLVSGDAVKLTKTPAGYHVDGRALADDVVGSVEAHEHLVSELLPTTVIAYEDTPISAGAAGSYFSGSPGVQTTFIAPTSGVVLVASSCVAREDQANLLTSAANLIITYRLGTTLGGSDIQAETLFERSVRETIFTTTHDYTGGGMQWSRASGLTSGQTYHAEWRGQQLTGAGNPVQIRGRKLIITPVV